MSEIISRKEARARGLKRYFTGKTCKHGHVDERYCTGNRCITCVLEALKMETYLAAKRQWRKENLMKIRENARNWKLRNPERAKELTRIRDAKRTAAYRALRELGIKF